MQSASITYDPVQRKLTVRGAHDFSAELFKYAADTEILDMSFGSLSSLPNTISDFIKLRVAFFSNNYFTEVPRELAGCTSLEMLGMKSCKISTWASDALPANIQGITLTDNQLTEIPASVGNYKRLQKLMLSGNQLQAIPHEILNCTNLQLLRLSANQLSASPNWLSELPNLAWFSDSGNTYNQHVLEGYSPQKYNWNELKIGKKLGESSKNVVYEATLSTGESVAVKLFGAAVSTDGLAIDDMAACLRTGDHPNIIGGLGELMDAPDNQIGLIMPLVPADYRPVGLPPNLARYTRDIAPEGAQKSSSVALQIACDIAAALKHLHARGVMHGDVYAHNVLANTDGTSLVGDFGAASLYDPGDESEHWRQAVDIRGFGYFLDDLLLFNTQAHVVDAIITRLQKVRDQCLRKTSNDQLSFTAIHDTLST